MTLNSVLLRCESLDERKFGGEIESGEGSYGTLTGLTSCDNRNQLHHFITSFQLQVEGNQVLSLSLSLSLSEK